MSGRPLLCLGSGNPVYGFLLFKLHLSLTIMWFATNFGSLRDMNFTRALILVFAKVGAVSRRIGGSRLAGATS